MGAKRHNWPELKAEFLTSKYLTVAEWAWERLGKKQGSDGRLAEKTKGWAEEKKAFTESVKAQVIAEAREKMVEIYRPSIAELGKMHKSVIDLYKLSLAKIANDCVMVDEKGKQVIVRMPDQKDLKDIWSVVKTEKGEATSVVEKVEPLSDEEESFLDSVIEEKDE